MKYIKKYESVNKPQIGDYVICEEINNNTTSTHAIEINKYVMLHIGQIIKIFPPTSDLGVMYVVKYENLPNELQNSFIFYDDIEHHDRRGFYTDEIKFYSTNKKDLEDILLLKKYNL